MGIWWERIEQWFEEEDRAIAKGFDSITLWTGDEGMGKSYTMLAINWVKSKGKFSIDRVHFDEEEGMADCVTLNPGDCVQFDEVDGHRRLAMTKKRMRMLKFLKERRALRLRLSIGFPHVQQLERDILNSRIRYWAHIAERVEGVDGKPGRVLVLVHRRRSRLENRQGQEPKAIVDFPLVGRFWIEEPSGPLLQAYDQKKWEFTHRDDDLVVTDLPPQRRIDATAALPVLDKIKALAVPANAGAGKPPNEAFFDQVLAELKT